MSSSLIGRKLGQYEVVSLLGQGGMATVYKGYQESIDRDVAIKVLPPHPGMDEQFIARFQLEARTIGGLQHPHILPLYDYGRDDDILYLAMAYIDGGSLDEMRGEPLDLRQAEKYLRQIASALDYAHRRGVVHRDIKPGNILLDTEGHALLADFGIVKMVEGEAELTGSRIVGTPAYMAPEQGQGLPVDGRADVYALGCVMYELITGVPPYNADTMMRVVFKHITDPIPDIRSTAPALPSGLSNVFAKVMAKDPDDRYQTAVEFAEDFTHAIHSHDESVINVRAETPLDRSPMPETPMTMEFGSGSEQQATVNFNQPTNPQQTPTVVLQSGTNPLVLLAGFGLIALVIVIVAIVLINPQGGGASPPTQGATALAEDPTDVPPTVEPTPDVPRVGDLRYNTADTINLTFDLDTPPAGMIYVAWLQNTETGETISLGQLNADPFGDGVLSYTDPDGNFLPAMYNAILISLETEAGDEPEGEIAYSGQIPIELTNAFHSIFLGADDGINGMSWLESAKTEAATGAQHSGLAAQASALGGMFTHVEHTLNILQGTNEDHDGNGRPANPGRGFGVYIFLDNIDNSLALMQGSAVSSQVQSNLELILVCTFNVRMWADMVVEIEQQVLTGEAIEDVADQAQEAADIAALLMSGVDANENGAVEAFEGECGLDQIPTFGIQAANIPLQEGGLDAE